MKTSTHCLLALWVVLTRKYAAMTAAAMPETEIMMVRAGGRPPLRRLALLIELGPAASIKYILLPRDQGREARDSVFH